MEDFYPSRRKINKTAVSFTKAIVHYYGNNDNNPEPENRHVQLLYEMIKPIYNKQLLQYGGFYGMSSMKDNGTLLTFKDILKYVWKVRVATLLLRKIIYGYVMSNSHYRNSAFAIASINSMIQFINDHPISD